LGDRWERGGNFLDEGLLFSDSHLSEFYEKKMVLFSFVQMALIFDIQNNPSRFGLNCFESNT
jgi:hypothetical protein